MEYKKKKRDKGGKSQSEEILFETLLSPVPQMLPHRLTDLFVYPFICNPTTSKSHVNKIINKKNTKNFWQMS